MDKSSFPPLLLHEIELINNWIESLENTPSIFPNRYKISLSHMDSDQISSVFELITFDPNSMVSILFQREKSGISLRWGDFCQDFSEFWTPGRDDIYVIPFDHSFLISLDHEENLTVLGMQAQLEKFGTQLKD